MLHQRREFSSALFSHFINKQPTISGFTSLGYSNYPPAAAELTHFQASEGKRVLSHKPVFRTEVVVFDDEADQRQLWHVHVKLEVLIPGWV